MADKNESMNGIIKLYELRREPVLREAREWFAGFYADSFDDVIELFKTEDERYFRMVLTYWEMAAAFVNDGAIDGRLFNQTTNEHIAAFGKIEPFIAEFRAYLNDANVLSNLEKFVAETPNSKETMNFFRERAREKQTLAKAVAA